MNKNLNDQFCHYGTIIAPQIERYIGKRTRRSYDEKKRFFKTTHILLLYKGRQLRILRKKGSHKQPLHPQGTATISL